MATFLVTSDSTLNNAITNAVRGDTILVATSTPLTPTGGNMIIPAGVTLTSDGSASNRVIYSTIDYNSDRSLDQTGIIVEKITLGGGIEMNDCDGTTEIRDCIIDGNADGSGRPNDDGISYRSWQANTGSFIVTRCTIKNFLNDGISLNSNTAGGTTTTDNSGHTLYVNDCTINRGNIGNADSDQLLTCHNNGNLIVDGGVYDSSDTGFPVADGGGDNDVFIIKNAILRGGRVEVVQLINCNLNLNAQVKIVPGTAPNNIGKIEDTVITAPAVLLQNASMTVKRVQIFVTEGVAPPNPLVSLNVSNSAFVLESCVFADITTNTTATGRLINFGGSVSAGTATLTIKNCTFYGSNDEAVRDVGPAVTNGIVITNSVFLQCGTDGGNLVNNSDGFDSTNSTNNYHDRLGSNPTDASADRINSTRFTNGDQGDAYDMVDYGNDNFRPVGLDNFIRGLGDLDTLAPADVDGIPFGQGEIGAFALPLTASTFFATTTLDGYYPGPLVTRMRKEYLDGKYKANLNLVTNQYFKDSGGAKKVAARVLATANGSTPTSSSTIIGTGEASGEYGALNISLDLSLISANPRSVIKYIFEFDHNPLNAQSLPGTWTYSFRESDEYSDIDPYEFRSSPHPNSEQDFRFGAIADTHINNSPTSSSDGFARSDGKSIVGIGQGTSLGLIDENGELVRSSVYDTARMFETEKGINHMVASRNNLDFLVFMGDEIRTYTNPANALGNESDDTDANTQALVKLHWTFFRRVFAPILNKMGVMFFISGNHEAEAGYTQKGAGEIAGLNGIPTGTDYKPQQWSTDARKTFFPNPSDHTYGIHYGEGCPIYDSSSDWKLVGNEDYYDKSSAALNDKPLENFGLCRWGKLANLSFLDNQRYTFPASSGGEPGDDVPRVASDWKWGTTQKQFYIDKLTKYPFFYNLIFAHHQAGGGPITVGGGSWSDTSAYYGRGLAVSARLTDTDQLHLMNTIDESQAQGSAFIQGHDHCAAVGTSSGVKIITCPRISFLNNWFQQDAMATEYGSVWLATPGSDVSATDFLRLMLGWAEFLVSRNGTFVRFNQTAFDLNYAGPLDQGVVWKDSTRTDYESYRGSLITVDSSTSLTVAQIPTDVDRILTENGASNVNNAFATTPSGTNYYSASRELNQDNIHDENYSSTTVTMDNFPDSTAYVDYVPRIHPEINEGFSANGVQLMNAVSETTERNNITTFDSTSTRYIDFSGWTLDGSDITLVSPVVDTGQKYNMLKNIKIAINSQTADDLGLSKMSFSFRASELSYSFDSTTPFWTRFVEVDLEDIINQDLNDLGVSVRGRYQQVRFNNIDTDAISEVVVFSDSNRPITSNSSVPAYEPGTIARQEADISAIATISKISLELDLFASSRRKQFRVVDNGSLSFAATNFQDSRNPERWTIHDSFTAEYARDINYSISHGYLTIFDDEDYNLGFDTGTAPFVQYDMVFEDTGVFDVWMRYFSEVDRNLWLQLDSNSPISVIANDTRNDPNGFVVSWQKVGQILISDAGIHSVKMYPGISGGRFVDQFYITKDVAGPSDFEIQPLSPGPFNTYVLLNTPDYATISSNWLSSNKFSAEGKYSYDLGSNTYSNNLEINFMQIGGNNKFFAAWKHKPNESSLGSRRISRDWGNNFVNI